MVRAARTLTLTALVALAWAGTAQARGGSYAFDGGTPKQQAQVRVALQASQFNWSLVPARITIHLRHGTDTYAQPGEIWIDTDLLNAGVFAWGLIQHEYAHQVDFFLLDDAERATLNALLGGAQWFSARGAAAFRGSAEHAALGSERFASTLAWAYWQAPENSLRPRSASDESAAMAPARLKALLSQMLGIPSPGAPVVVVR